ncbi:MAG: hypothetical protein AAGU27_17945 [Dehalobacterium sp.]
MGVRGIDLSVLEQWDFSILNVKPHGSVTKLETDVGAKCLQTRDEFSKDIFYYFLLLEHLAQQGFKRIPRFIRTRYGEPYIKTVGRCYWVTDWIYGRYINLKDQDDVVKSVQALARFHTASGGFYFPGEKEEKDHWGSNILGIADQIAKIKFQIKGPAFFKENLQMIAERALNSCKELVGPGYKWLRHQLKGELSVCHSAFNRNHIILGKSGEIYLTGLVHWKRDIRLRDLAEFLLMAGEMNQWDDKLCHKTVLTYHKISPLLSIEMELLQDFLRFPFGYLGLLQDLAQKNAGVKETRIRLESYLRLEEKKEKCLINLF